MLRCVLRECSSSCVEAASRTRLKSLELVGQSLYVAFAGRIFEGRWPGGNLRVRTLCFRSSRWAAGPAAATCSQRPRGRCWLGHPGRLRSAPSPSCVTCSPPSPSPPAGWEGGRVSEHCHGGGPARCGAIFRGAGQGCGWAQELQGCSLGRNEPTASFKESRGVCSLTERYFRC